MSNPLHPEHPGTSPEAELLKEKDCLIEIWRSVAPTDKSDPSNMMLGHPKDVSKWLGVTTENVAEEGKKVSITAASYPVQPHTPQDHLPTKG